MTDSLISLGASAYHFGNSVNIKEMLDKFPQNYIVMGNIDPLGVLNKGTTEMVQNRVLELIAECSEFDNFVLSSGCDIPPNTPWENIDAFFDSVAES